METPYLYIYLNILTILFPFLLSFDKKVAFYKKWGTLLPAILCTGALFIGWDVVFTYLGIWSFNEQYLTGINLINLPLEEWLFFLTVPYACAFIYVCLNVYFPKNWLKPYENKITLFVVALLTILLFFNWGAIYTTTTIILTLLYIFIEKYYLKKVDLANFYRAYLVSLIPFLLVNGALTGAFTQEPVVIYNDTENMGIRLFTIPCDDLIYCFLLLLMAIRD